MMMAVMGALPEGTNMRDTVMVIDYLLCTITVSKGEEVAVLRALLDIVRTCPKDWHPTVFNPDVIALAIEGKVPTKDGGTKAADIADICTRVRSKRAALYLEHHPTICDVAEGIRKAVLSPAGSTKPGI